MQLLPLLGKRLKDDDVIEVLEGMEMDVLYDFDRLHEGEPDKYWAASKESGIQFGFDAAQALDVIFLRTVPADGFAAFSRDDCDVPLFSTIAQARAFGEARGRQVSNGSGDFLGITRDWIKIGFAKYSIHYEFRAGVLALVTISKE